MSQAPTSQGAAAHSREGGEHGGSHFDVTAATAHGEELREQAEHSTWHDELHATLRSLNELLAIARSAKHPESRRLEFLRQPLVTAAIVTGLATAGSAFAINYFQSREAHNAMVLQAQATRDAREAEATRAQTALEFQAQQARDTRNHELYKSKLEFAATFGDTFPRSLNLLFRNTRAGLWLDRHAAAADEPAADATAQTKELHQRFLTEYARFEDTRREMLDAKKTSTLCAQALMLFEQTPDRPLDELRATIKAIQDVRDDETTPYEEQEKLLDKLHNRANEAFTRVLNMFGDGLRDDDKPIVSKGVSGESKPHK